MNAVCIRTLGPPVVRVNGAELVALPAQRLRCALLVFLAVERETTRENVLATFWPERPVERARHAFSQTLYELRRLLGDDWVDVQGERVVVRGIAVDAVELEAAVARGDTETAVRLYGGPFLDGFALDLKPFEAWAERRRAQLGRSHRKASRDRIAALLQAGNLAAALEVSRRWAELDPLEDEAEHRYLELLVQAGHRGDALRVYAEYERLLQRELQVEPLDETKELVARLRAGELESGPAWGEVQRARLQADISELNVLGVVNATGDAGTVQAPRDTRSSVAPSAARVEPVPANRRSSHLDRLAFALGGAAVLALLILGYGSSSSHSSASRVTPGAAGYAPAVAILPFGVSDPALQKWRTGVLLSLAAGIDGAAGMHAVDPQAVLESLNENAGSANTISHAPDRSQALGVGRRTGARYAIAGNVVAIDSSVRITADLYETATGARLQEFQSEGSSAQMFALLDALAIEIIRTMVRRERRDAGVSRTDVGGHLTTSLPALKAYLQAEQLNQQSRFEEATQWYERALQSDGTFTLMFSRFLVRYSYVGEAIPKSVPDPLAPALRALDHLSRRDALMVRANQEVARDNIPGAVNLLLQASREYPDDYEVWYSLGEITIHEAGDLLLGPEDALRAFSNAMQLNPSYGPPYEHLIELLLGERGDSARAVQVNSAYQRLAPDADHREWGPLSLALAFGSPTARARAMSAVDTLPLPVVMQLAHYLNQPRFRRSQEQLFGVVARRVTEQDVVLHPFVAAARIALGQLSGAVASALESVGCRGNAIYFAYLIVRAPLPPEAEAALQASRSRVNSCPGGTDVFLSGAYAADVGRWAAVDSTRAFLAALARRQLGIGDSLKARHTRLLAEALHGYQVARAGDVEQGIRMLQSLQPQLRGSAVVRWWLGELLLENGRPREARVYFASYWGDKEGIPASYFLARIDEQLGNRAQARAEYARFADGWRNADREVQPYVAEARARIAALDKRVH